MTVFVFSDNYGKASEFIPCGDDVATVFKNKNAGAAVDNFLCKFDSVGEIIFKADKRRKKFNGVYFAAGHGVEETAFI